MLRNRSRAVSSKQASMADHSSQSPSTHNHTKPIQSFFGSPRFKDFTFRTLPEAEPGISPTSILEPFTCFKNPFSSPRNFSENKHWWDMSDSKGIGVALIDSDDNSNEHNKIKPLTKPCNKMVLLGKDLRVQIPPCANFMLSGEESATSPCDFGIKTRSCDKKSGSGYANSVMRTKECPPEFTECASMSELELSEDYTCVISYGPNPKTTHIFDSHVLDNYSSVSDGYKSNNFLSFCHTCKKNLAQKKTDIFIYRGEKAFCSEECRYQEMLLDGLEN